MALSVAVACRRGLGQGFCQGVPRPAVGALAQPFGRGSAAFSAGVEGFVSGHGHRSALACDYSGCRCATLMRLHERHSPSRGRAAKGRRQRTQAAVSQYPELNGLLMRSARGEMSTSLSVGIFSAQSPPMSIPCTAAGFAWASLARSAWPVVAERATEKNRNTGTVSCDRPSSRLRRGTRPEAARGLPCRTWRWQGSAPAPR